MNDRVLQWVAFWIGYRRQTGVEDFDLDDTLHDWRFAREAAKLYRAKMQELKNA